MAGRGESRGSWSLEAFAKFVERTGLRANSLANRNHSLDTTVFAIEFAQRRGHYEELHGGSSGDFCGRYEIST